MHDWSLSSEFNFNQGATIFSCKHCNVEVSMNEKISLEAYTAQKESLKIQECNTRISMWSNIISAITLIVAFLTLLFGDKIITCIS